MFFDNTANVLLAVGLFNCTMMQLLHPDTNIPPNDVVIHINIWQQKTL